MIKVLHIFGQMAPGGAELRTLELQPFLRTMGVHSDFCAIGGQRGMLANRCKAQGSAVHHCPLMPSPIRFALRFLKLLNASNYDIIHSHVHYFSGWITLSARLAGVRGRIVHFRNTDDGSRPSAKRKLYTRLMKSLIHQNATAILAVCKGAMSDSWRYDWHRDVRCQVIYNGLDTERFHDASPLREELVSLLGISPSSYLAITVAHLHAQKGHRQLIAAAKRVIAHTPDVHFLFVGDGPMRNQLQEFAQSMGVASNIHFLGYRSDIPQLLASCDCFILPSLWEGLPGAILEAIAANLPVVASALPGVIEIANHTNLVQAVPVGDESALAAAIRERYSQKNTTIQSMGASFPEVFDLGNCAEHVFRVYQQQINLKGSRRRKAQNK